MAIIEKLFKIRRKVGIIEKNQSNDAHKSLYFDINALIGAIDPILVKHKVLLIQPIRMDHVATVLIDIEDDNPETNRIESTMYFDPNMDPQSVGSAVTYFRRYTLQSLLATKSKDDDDGNRTMVAKPVVAGEIKRTTTRSNPPRELEKPNPWLNSNMTDALIAVITEFKAGKKMSDIRKTWSISRKVEAIIKSGVLPIEAKKP